VCKKRRGTMGIMGHLTEFKLLLYKGKRTIHAKTPDKLSSTSITLCMGHKHGLQIITSYWQKRSNENKL